MHLFSKLRYYLYLSNINLIDVLIESKVNFLRMINWKIAIIIQFMYNDSFILLFIIARA